MQKLSYILFITAVFDITFAFVVYLKSRKKENTLAKYYLLLFGTIGIWELSMWAAIFTSLKQPWDFIIHASSYALGLVGIFLMLVFVSVLSNFTILPKKFIKALGLVVILFSILSFVPNIILIVPQNYGLQTNIDLYSSPGPFMPFYYLVILPFFLAILYVIINAYRKSRARLTKCRLIIVGISFTFVLLMNVTSSVFIPFYLQFVKGITVSVSSYWFITQQCISLISLSVVSFAVAYAITRYRFMNIKLEIQQRFVYSTTFSVVLLLIFFIAVYIFQFTSLITSVSVAAIILLLYVQFLDKRFRFFLDGLFFLNKLDTSKTFPLEKDTLDPEHRLKLWAIEITEQLKKEGVDLIHAYALQRQHNRMFDYTTKQKDENYIWLNHQFVKYLNKHSEQLFFSIEDIRIDCKHRANVVVQLRFKNQLMGVLFLSTVEYNPIALSALLRDYAYICYAAVQWYEAAIGVKRTAKEMIYHQNQ